jgi:DNA-binding LytR/AlgR family response regulator
MAKVRVLIAEDEVIVADDITARLQRLGYEVVGPVDTGEEVIKIMAEQEVDLVLLDICLMGEIDGISVAEQIRKHHSLPLIYLTSLSDSETVLRAKVTKPSAYILKPFNERELQIAIDMAVANYSSGEEESPAEEVDVNTQDSAHFFMQRSIFVKEQHCYRRIDISEIHWAEASGNYTQLHTSSKTHLFTILLSKLMDKLPSPPFLRVHRSYLVNLNFVDGFSGNRLFIGEQEIPVSKAFQETVFQHFPKM